VTCCAAVETFWRLTIVVVLIGRCESIVGTLVWSKVGLKPVIGCRVGKSTLVVVVVVMLVRSTLFTLFLVTNSFDVTFLATVVAHCIRRTLALLFEGFTTIVSVECRFFVVVLAIRRSTVVANFFVKTIQVGFDVGKCHGCWVQITVSTKCFNTNMIRRFTR